MEIKDLNSLSKSTYLSAPGNYKFELYPKDENGRDIEIFSLKQTVFLGQNLCYPNIFSYSALDKQFYKVIREEIMSLNGIHKDSHEDFHIGKALNFREGNFFFFCFNTDNYYHFIYDTLPYLISFFQIKKVVPNLKLIMSFPNPFKNSQYKFVYEFLEILGIPKSEIVMVNKDYIYENVYFSSSYTHDGKSKLPPRKEIYNLYRDLVNLSNLLGPSFEYEKIYVSRRTWLHGDLSNIGTNYTDRRSMKEENEVAEYLIDLGFREIFTENLSTIEKINIFSKAKIIVGSIGGGIANVLFSPPETILLALVSPGFLDVNERFKFSLDQVDVKYFTQSRHTESGIFKTNVRVQCSNGIIGEVKETNNNLVTIKYCKDRVAGWNSQSSYEEIVMNTSECKPLDNGLNSPWSIDFEKFKKIVDKINK